LAGENAGLGAIGDSAVTVGYADSHALLATDDGPNARGCAGFDYRCGGEAGQVFHPFPLQNLSDCVNGTHDVPPLKAPFLGSLEACLKTGRPERYLAVL
jgi:hypothetical protein